MEDKINLIDEYSKLVKVKTTNETNHLGESISKSVEVSIELNKSDFMLEFEESCVIPPWITFTKKEQLEAFSKVINDVLAANYF